MKREKEPGYKTKSKAVKVVRKKAENSCWSEALVLYIALLLGQLLSLSPVSLCSLLISVATCRTLPPYHRLIDNTLIATLRPFIELSISSRTLGPYSHLSDPNHSPSHKRKKIVHVLFFFRVSRTFFLGSSSFCKASTPLTKNTTGNLCNFLWVLRNILTGDLMRPGIRS